MFDLFGNYIPVEKEKTLEEEYAEYINSTAWKRLRDAKIKQAGEKCERCNKSKWSVKLEVHHKNYEHFKREKLDDLEVVCHDCHTGADKERVAYVEDKQERSPLAVGFENWMDRSNLGRWRRMSDEYMETYWKSFLKYLNGRTKREYNIPFKRRFNWYE
jgi:hypothetical protein